MLDKSRAPYGSASRTQSVTLRKGPKSSLRLKLSPANVDGSLLSDEEYGLQKSRLLAEKVRLEEQLRDVEHRVEQWTEIAEQTFVFACYAREWFAKGTFEDKRHILMAVGSNPVLKDKILRIDAKNPSLSSKKGSGHSVPKIHRSNLPKIA